MSYSYAGGTGRPERPLSDVASPAQFAELRFEIGQAVGERLAIPLLGALFEVVKHPRAVQQQALALALRVEFFLGEPDFADSPVGVGRINLRLNRFAFPASGHALLYPG